MSNLAKQYFDNLIERLQKLAEEQIPAIEQAANMLADTIENGHRIFAFGCTHSSLPIQDLVYRAGGLMLINPIYAPALTAMDARPATLSTSIERIPGYAKAVLDNQPLEPDDVLIVVSVSGRNHMPIEMAQEAQTRGLKVIGLTSRKYSGAVSSRHPSGKKMHEFVDIILDCQVDPGDAVLEAEGVPQKFCPVSGVINPAILQAMVAATVEELLNRGITPPVFLAANVPGGDEYNAKLMAQYKDRIFYM
jgi:uncharacterized phosphosugar-binding protein